MKNPFIKNARRDYDDYDDNYDNNFYRGDDEDDGVVEDDGQDVAFSRAPANDRQPQRSASPAPGAMKVLKPQSPADAPDIADALADGYSVVMNIEEMDAANAVRLIDFLLGVIHVLGGEMRRVTKTTMVLSPRKGQMSEDQGGRL